jgi:hypothetical protein
MKIDRVDFNIQYWSQFSKDDFLKQCIQDGIFKEYANRIALLEEVYHLIQNELNLTRTSTET